MHQRFNGNRLAIPCRTVEDDAPLPRHTKILVDVFTIEESVHEFGDCLLHILIQDNILPCRFLNLLIQVPTLLPEPAIVDIDEFLILRLLPVSHGSNEFVGNAVACHDGLPLSGLFQYVLELLEPHLHDINDEKFSAPFIEVFGEASGFDELVWDTTSSVAGVEVAVALDGFIDDVELGGGMASSSELEEGH